MTTVGPGHRTSEMGWVSVISGFIAIVISPISWFLVGRTGAAVLCGTLVASPILALVALICGILASIKRDQLGYVGIILAIIAWMLLIIPVLHVITPTST